MRFSVHTAGRQVPLQPLWRRDQQVEPDPSDSSVVELAVPCGARPTLSAQRRHMLQILPALLRAPFVAGLVLGGDQRMGAAAPIRREVKVARRAPDALLDVGPPILDRL